MPKHISTGHAPKFGVTYAGRFSSSDLSLALNGSDRKNMRDVVGMVEFNIKNCLTLHLSFLLSVTTFPCILSFNLELQSVSPAYTLSRAPNRSYRLHEME